MTAACLAPPFNEPVLHCVLHQCWLLAVFICWALNIQHQVFSCSKDSHLEPSVRGGPEVTLFRRDLGVLACSLLHSLMRTNWRAALSPSHAWLFPEHTWLCCPILYCHGHHTLCAITSLLPLSLAKLPGSGSSQHLACCGRWYCLKAGWERHHQATAAKMARGWENNCHIDIRP